MRNLAKEEKLTHVRLDRSMHTELHIDTYVATTVRVWTPEVKDRRLETAKKC